MHPVIYDLHLHAYQHIGGVMVSIVLHDPARRTFSSEAILRRTMDVEIDEQDLDPDKWVRDVLVAAAELL